MSTPAWILDIFAIVMLLVAEVSAGQLVIACAWTRRGGTDADIAVSHLLMGIAVAGILVPGLRTLPNAVWEFVFAAMTAWFAWCLWRESRGRAAPVTHGHYAPHLVQGAALLDMFAALTGAMPTLHASTLALIFALLLIAFTVYDVDRSAGVDGYFRVVGRRSALAVAAAGPVALRQPTQRLLLSPAVVKGCQVAISVTIAFILIIMI
jgi:hypothetical protein